MVVSQFDPDLVIEAIKITGGVTLMMMMLGAIYPAFFKKISGALFAALLAVIVIELFQAIFLGVQSGWIDWVVVAIFCGYIGYDWGRANQIPKTVDNAIDSAAALYMDIINLFLRILRILGRNK
jgi:FtsH-binding integral membrane protein